jgi:hypothetical protein
MSYDPSHPTLFGEVRVSKQLLDRDLAQQTVGFRAGYLLYPSDLLGVLEDSDYLFDSSVSAQYVLTNFPYFGFRQRSLGSEHSKIVVVPVALDDSRGELHVRNFLTSETKDEALRTWTEVIRANTENGAITCLLIHPTDTTYKLETERRLVAANRGDGTWIGDMGSLARFWRERALLRPSLHEVDNGTFEVVLNLTRRELTLGQSLVVEVPAGGAVPVVRDTEGEPIPVRVRVEKDRIYLVLP